MFYVLNTSRSLGQKDFLNILLSYGREFDTITVELLFAIAGWTWIYVPALFLHFQMQLSFLVCAIPLSFRHLNKFDSFNHINDTISLFVIFIQILNRCESMELQLQLEGILILTFLLHEVNPVNHEEVSISYLC